MTHASGEKDWVVPSKALSWLVTSAAYAAPLMVVVLFLLNCIILFYVSEPHEIIAGSINDIATLDKMGQHLSLERIPVGFWGGLILAYISYRISNRLSSECSNRRRLLFYLHLICIALCIFMLFSSHSFILRLLPKDLKDVPFTYRMLSAYVAGVYILMVFLFGCCFFKAIIINLPRKIYDAIYS